ncbi:MAG TPA: helix-turn-helix domain-containing protein [Spongiibacteraceae bacterium]|jgi:DNA-binding IclR family transcriptional regulator|nr:helix-turn-helix domain-containing protein [Spongiibacteraceae bacterium]HUH37051.1 helix-turn-helix domain-containing protein [Spongiibacteraceae bacterium]
MPLFSKPTARALAILDLLMANPDQAFGLTEMTRKLGLNKATCHAILTTMASYGYLVQDQRSKAYRLGPSIVAAGNAAYAQFPALEYARPELEKLSDELGLASAVTGRSGRHIVLLAHYGNANTFQTPFQLGLRVPNIAPLGSAFIAWSPAKQLEAWIARAHEARGGFDEQLDKRLRMSVINIRARGYEATFKTAAVDDLERDLSKLDAGWNLEQLESITNDYQLKLCEQAFHIDRIDPKTSYDISTVSVPVYGYNQEPQLVFTIGSIIQELRGSEIADIARRLTEAATRVTVAARSSVPLARVVG